MYNDQSGNARGGMQANNDPRLPDGYISMQGRLDQDMLAQQSESLATRSSYFQNKKRVQDTTFNVHQRDLVFAIDGGDAKIFNGSNEGPSFNLGAENGEGGGEAIVTSSLNGLDGVICMPESIKKYEHHVDMFVHANIRVLGQAFTEMAYNHLGETSARSFGIQCGGIITQISRGNICVGEYVRSKVCPKSEYLRDDFAMGPGIEPSKIGLIVAPVREFECTYFMQQCYSFARHMDDTAPALMNSTFANTALFGRTLENMFLSSGLLMVYWLMKYGILQVETPSGAGNPNDRGRHPQDDLNTLLTSGGQFSPGEFASLVPLLQNISSTPITPYRDYTNQHSAATQRNYQDHTTLPLPSNGRTRASTAFYTATAGGRVGSFEQWARNTRNAPLQNAADLQALVQNAGITSYTSPEQTVAILSSVFGLIDPTRAQEPPSNPSFSFKPALDAMNNEQKQHFANCKSVILDSVFRSSEEGSYDSLSRTIPKERLEVGYSPVGASRLSKKVVNGGRDRADSYVPSRNGYNLISNAFANQLPLVGQAFTHVTGMHRSMILGKALRQGTREQTVDVLI